MELTEIEALLEAFQKSGMHKMSLETQGMTLHLQRSPECTAPAQREPSQGEEHAAVQVQQVQTAPVTVQVPAAPEQAAPVGTPVKAGLVGVFYASAAPGDEPFVKEGQHIEQGQTLCILEAMKMLNEVKAPASGTVLKVLAQAGELVEYGQTLMTIQE